MPKQPAYFDSQASAAAALGIDIEVLREAKRQGCPAFRSGRVYREQLLSWLEARDLKKSGSIKLNGIGLEERRSAIAQTIRGLCVCANLGVLTTDQFFDVGKAIVDAADDPELREVLRQRIENFVQLKFSEIAEAKARKAHPKMMAWFRAETKVQARRNRESLDLGAIIRKLDTPLKLPALSEL